MIAAISWVPKGVAKSVPAAAEPPSKEEIEEILKSGILAKRYHPAMSSSFFHKYDLLFLISLEN